MSRKSKVVKIKVVRERKLSFTAPENVIAVLSEDFASRGTSLGAHLRLHLISLMNAKPKVYDLKTPMGFGKYHGVRMEDIIRIDPDYVRWLLSNVDRFAMTDKATTLYEDVCETLERNLQQREAPIEQVLYTAQGNMF